MIYKFFKSNLRKALLWWRLRKEPRYVKRWILRLQSGRRHSTLGNDIKNEALTRQSAQGWLEYLISIGLKPNHICIEIGCGSLWAAEPVIRYLHPGNYFGMDITKYFYELGAQRLESLIMEKNVTLELIVEESIQRASERNAHFVFARKVLAHVRKSELNEFMTLVCRLVGDRTTLVLDNPFTFETRLRNPGTIEYALADIVEHVPSHLVCSQDERAILIRPLGLSRSI